MDICVTKLGKVEVENGFFVVFVFVIFSLESAISLELLTLKRI